jgi:prolipoprotein diacylglyceryltransferase
MDVAVSAFAVIVALGCFIAIFMATRKDKKKDEQADK